MNRTSLMMCLVLLGGIADFGLSQNVRSSVDRHSRPEGGFFENQRASRNIQHSRQYARDLYQYSRSTPTIAPQVMQNESAMLGQSIANAQRELAAAQSFAASSPRQLAAANAATGHLAKASEIQKKLNEECHKPSPDGKVCCLHCSDIIKELDKAQAEHESILREKELEAESHSHPTESK